MESYQIKHLLLTNIPWEILGSGCPKPLPLFSDLAPGCIVSCLTLLLGIFSLFPGKLPLHCNTSHQHLLHRQNPPQSGFLTNKIDKSGNAHIIKHFQEIVVNIKCLGCSFLRYSAASKFTIVRSDKK